MLYVYWFVVVRVVVIILKVLLCSAIGGVLYRIGGWSEGNTKVRDLGVPSIGVLMMLWIGYTAPIWAWIVAFLLEFGAMTDYARWVDKILFGKKSDDVMWYHWLIVGTEYGLAMLPFAIATQRWTGFLIRLGVVMCATMWWSEREDDVILEEGGRGVIATITKPLLFI